MIKTHDLTKRFDDLLVVDRLNIEVGEGEIFGFLGPNGAGKTTTVRMLTSLIGPTSGTATVMGYEVGEADIEIRRRVGVLTEAPGHYDHLTAHRNLLIYAKLYEVDDPETQVEKYLKILGLWDRRNDKAATYSKGMKQKLAIARALLHEPRLLFLDEPTSGLDPEMARLVREFIAELKEEKRTIFMCTHNLGEAERLCDRVAVFNSRLRVVDTPSNLRQQLYGRQVVFHLAGEAAAQASVLKPLEFVKDVQSLENKLLVMLDDPEQQNPEIIRRLVNAGADIQFVGEIRHSLEDVYLQMVRDVED